MNRTFCRIAGVGRTFAQRCNVLATSARPVKVLRLVYASTFRQRTFTYLDNENYNAHNTMANDPMYSETIVNPSVYENWPIVTDCEFHGLIKQGPCLKSPNEVCDDFVKISVYITGKDYHLMDNIFDGIRNRLIAELPNITDDQLMTVLRYIPLWNVQNTKDPLYYSFWSKFDKECMTRYKKWSLNKLLLFMDYWYLMKLSKLSNFVWIGVRKLGRKPSRLTPKQLVQMMFYANASRKFSPSVPMYEIEQEICSYYNDFSIKELGIVALGFFKTQTPIRNQELVQKLYYSVANDIDKIRSVELAAFLKIFRYCSNHKNADNMYKFMELLADKVNDVELVCCVHMALLGTNLLIKHERLLKKISQRIIDEISQARIKDIERITLSFCMLNYNPQTMPCVFETFVNELHKDSRNVDFEHYTKCFIFTLSYLVLKNIFPYDCISKCLKAETLHKCFGKKLSKFNVPRDILCLNNSLMIECPDYSGPLLPDALQKSCSEHLAWHLPTASTLKKLSIGDKNFLNIYRELLRLFANESYLHVCYLLPHLPKADIIFCIDADGKPVSIPDKMKKKSVFNDLKKPPALGKWFAVLILVRNSVIYNSNEYNGLTLCKIRQLKKLGYEPILISTKETVNYSEVNSVISEKLKIHGITLS